MQVLRAGRGCCCTDKGCLCMVLLMVPLTRSLKWTTLVVFLKLLWGRVQCGCVQVNEGVIESDAFGSLPQATCSGRGR